MKLKVSIRPPGFFQFWYLYNVLKNTVTKKIGFRRVFVLKSSFKVHASATPSQVDRVRKDWWQVTLLQELRSVRRSHLESDVFSERDEWSVSSDSYDEIEFEDFDSFALDKNADKSDDEEGPYSQEPLANDQWLQEYQQERRIIEARERELQNRMDRVVEQDSW